MKTLRRQATGNQCNEVLFLCPHTWPCTAAGNTPAIPLKNWFEIIEQRRTHKVLLVEDNPDDAELIQQSMRKIRSASLRCHGRQIVFCPEKLAPETFDVVVTDLGLPESKGIKSFWRSMLMYPDIPIIVLTGLSDEELAVNGAQRSSDYLVKGDISVTCFLKSLRHSMSVKGLWRNRNKLKETDASNVSA